MGMDFVTSKAKAFTKQWDGARAALAVADLLAAEAELLEQEVLFEVHDGFTLSVGEDLVVQLSGDELVALRGHDIVATAVCPPAGVVAFVKTAHGFALGCVTRYSAVSRTADVAFRVA
jgi:hypothetical protein